MDTLTSVDLRENVKMAGKVIEIYEGVIYWENFKRSQFRKFIQQLFTSKKIQRWKKRFIARVS